MFKIYVRTAMLIIKCNYAIILLKCKYVAFRQFNVPNNGFKV